MVEADCPKKQTLPQTMKLSKTADPERAHPTAGNRCKCRWFRLGRRLRLVASNAVVAGVEVASAVAFSVLPPLMLKSGFRESTMSILFGIGEKTQLLLL